MTERIFLFGLTEKSPGSLVKTINIAVNNIRDTGHVIVAEEAEIERIRGEKKLGIGSALPWKTRYSPLSTNTPVMVVLHAGVHYVTIHTDKGFSIVVRNVTVHEQWAIRTVVPCATPPVKRIVEKILAAHGLGVQFNSEREAQGQNK
jgi:hypothetical protein